MQAVRVTRSPEEIFAELVQAIRQDVIRGVVSGLEGPNGSEDEEGEENVASGSNRSASRRRTITSRPKASASASRRPRSRLKEEDAGASEGDSKLAEGIMKFAGKQDEPFAISQVMGSVSAPKPQVARALKDLVEARKLRRSGERRGTRYVAA